MLTIKEAEEILKKEYYTENFEYLMGDVLLPDYHKDVHDVPFNNTLFSSVKMLGESNSCEVTVFEVFVNKECQNRRVGITQQMFKILRGLHINNAIVAFVNADKNNYRISLLTSKYEFDGDKIVKVLSNPRRFSYSLGYGTKTKTAYKFLIEKGKVESLNELTSRFSVEIVNKQFYSEIATAFTQLVGGERNGKTYNRVLGIYGVIEHNKYAEFGVRLIGRIMFCWFLREKRSENGIPLVPDDMLSVDAINESNNYYHQILEPLFFELLNTNQNRRKSEYQSDYYNKVPYLNGGLFSPQTDDHYKYDTVSHCGAYGVVNIPNEWFAKLYSVLNEYNFTVDENTSYDIELSIDPEMLGRIFENLLAEINPETGENAKKSTGSFYTPRDIVDYMVDSSLCEYLKNKTGIDEIKIKALLSYNKEDDYLAVFDNVEKKKLINALYTVTALDPACGSGAFPIGMLQKIVYMLQELDPDATLWFDKATENVSILIKKEFEKKFNSGSLNYIRKLSVIQNSIFGIDIQPIAVEISRLRCFLSLIIEEKVHDDEENRGINPLPNLDFKFIIANSLLPLPYDEGFSKDQISIFENQDHMERLKAVREEYFGTNDYALKNELKVQFADIQKEMFQETLSRDKMASAKYSALSNWSPFKNEPTDWFDADWMFGIKDGFDIVIANPPYIDSETMTRIMPNKREKYASIYLTAKGNWDMYIPFWEKAFNLINKNGIVTFITPNKWLAIKYGEKLRELLFDHITSINDYTGFYAFESAGVSTVVVSASKQQIGTIVINKFDSSFMVKKCRTINKTQIKPFDNLCLCLSDNLDVLLRIIQNEKLIEHYSISGAATVSETYEIATIVDELNESCSNDYFKFINTGTINKFSTNWGKKQMTYVKRKYLRPIIKKENLLNLFPKRYEQSASPKLITTGIRYFKVFGDFYGEYCAAKSTEIITSKDGSGIKHILPILNSSVTTFFLKEAYGGIALGGGITFSPNNLCNIPIPPISSVQKKILENYVDRFGNNFSQKEQIEMDKYVFSLFSLSDAEAKIITENS